MPLYSERESTSVLEPLTLDEWRQRPAWPAVALIAVVVLPYLLLLGRGPRIARYLPFPDRVDRGLARDAADHEFPALKPSGQRLGGSRREQRGQQQQGKEVEPAEEGIHHSRVRRGAARCVTPGLNS